LRPDARGSAAEAREAAIGENDGANAAQGATKERTAAAARDVERRTFGVRR